MTEKKAILNTFHSSTSRYLRDEELEEIIALDGRFEVNIVEGTYYKSVERLPRVLAQAFLSHNIHLLMGRVKETNFFIDENCLKLESDFLSKNFGLPFNEEDSKELEESINECLDTEFNFIDPKKIDTYREHLDRTFLDVGLSYFEEYQDRVLAPSMCSSPGSKDNFFNLLEEVKPKTVIVSNVRDPKEIEKFLEELRDFGYAVEEGQIFETDKAEKAIDLYNDFVDFHLSKIDKGKDKYSPKSRAEDLKTWIMENSPFEGI